MCSTTTGCQLLTLKNLPSSGIIHSFTCKLQDLGFWDFTIFLHQLQCFVPLIVNGFITCRRNEGGKWTTNPRTHNLIICLCLILTKMFTYQNRLKTNYLKNSEISQVSHPHFIPLNIWPRCWKLESTLNLCNAPGHFCITISQLPYLDKVFFVCFVFIFMRVRGTARMDI